MHCVNSDSGLADLKVISDHMHNSSDHYERLLHAQAVCHVDTLLKQMEKAGEDEMPLRPGRRFLQTTGD